ncbi:DNA cytosine methyltransferase [Candidatus Palauibacter sp.]|uniref:DNA cytosine methyltransferase n=1 Tax=Candidatus Palauibacter sp. TaxID=3101350 RepID=UPI003B5B8C78
MMDTVRALDMFCGAGGSSVGAAAAGVKIVSGIDACPIATETYKANFPRAEVIQNRLECIDLADLRHRVGRVDLVLASPECRNHTCARGGAPLDEASRETALLTIEYARAFEPRWLVLENVMGTTYKSNHAQTTENSLAVAVFFLHPGTCQRL